MKVSKNARTGRAARLLALGAASSLVMAGHLALAQESTDTPETAQSQDQDERSLDTVTVTGVRQVVRDSIATKKDQTAIVDAITASDIGDLPALSLSDVLETITGAGAHRGKGGGSEIAIRGLGPFLGATTFNGGQATNGSGDRSVNFSQFPSELVNSVTVYKSQQADLVEGGIAGVIDIGTVRPLDYGRRRLRGEVKANYSEYADNMEFGDAVGWRGTLSYIDQFEGTGIGDIGFSVGAQINSVTNPQDRLYGSSGWTACDQAVSIPELGDTSNSDTRRGRYPRCTDNAITPGSDQLGNPYYLVPNSFGLRQQGEEDRRDALFGAIQWQPNDRWDINIDAQISIREFTEDRHDLIFNDARRIGPDYEVAENGALTYFEGTSQISSQGDYFTRNEDYVGWRANVAYDVTDRLRVSADYSYSDTVRNDFRSVARLRSDTQDVFGNNMPQRADFPASTWAGEFYYTWDYRNTDVPVITLDPRVDVNDWTIYSDDLNIQQDETEKAHNIQAFKLEANYLVGGFVETVDVGVRFARMEYNDFFRREQRTQGNRDLDRQAWETCQIPFPQKDFLKDASGANITSWATFDTLCMFEHYYGSEVLEFADNSLQDPQNVDVTEETLAYFAMANYSTTLGGRPLRGNFGVRVVETDIESVGLRTGLMVVDNGDGTFRLEEDGSGFDTVTFNNSFTDVLPSVNAIYELSDTVFLRGAVYKAMARPDPQALGAGRRFSLNGSEDGFLTLEEAIREVTAEGSPFLEPLRAWNYDLSLEWYPNADTLLSLAVYYKSFQGGTIPVSTNETFIIDGTPVVVPVETDQTTDDKSGLVGFEINLAYTFSDLPKPFDTLGVKVGYNWADADYEREDIALGDQIIAETGQIIQGVIPPAGISGFSEQVISAQLFWTIGDLDLQAIYSYRSEYYQDFVGGNSQLRYVPDTDTLNLRATYQVNDWFRLRAEAINVTNEPRIDFMPVMGSFRDYQLFGPTLYLGASIDFR